MENKKNTPLWEQRLNDIRVAVWENINPNDGVPWWNVSLTRRFKQNGEYRDASTFNGLADLALAQEAVKLAQAFIIQRQQEISVSP